MKKQKLVNAIVPYFGANRLLAESVGKALAGCSWVGVPFAGSMAELQYIEARSLVVSDLHRDVIRLARIIANPSRCRTLIRVLKRTPFHPESLDDAQQRCRTGKGNAIDFFVTQWMGRSGNAGTEKEFEGNLSTRWNGNGGDSNTRYRSAVRSLVYWHRIMRRCNFHVMDAFEFVAKCNDTPDTGIYCDPPWPGDGDEYRHKFTEQQQRDLADELGGFEQARIVVRYGDHPLIRALYKAPQWTWHEQTSRTQGNNGKAEVLIVRCEPAKRKITRPRNSDAQGGLFE